MLVRWIAALVTFLVVAAAGVALAGGIPERGEADPITFAFQQVADVLALILGIALLVSIAVYLVIERVQTGGNASVTTQFTTRTLILMPMALLMNYVMYRIGAGMFASQNLRVRLNIKGFLIYALGYSLILQPASVAGYMSELLGMRKTWGSK